MGFFTQSVQECKSIYSIDVNCNPPYSHTSGAGWNETDPNATVGAYLKGQVPPDPDIAGIGMLCSFMMTTMFGGAFSIFVLHGQFFNHTRWRFRESLLAGLPQAPIEKYYTWLDVFETVAGGMSDGQVLLGIAYSMALRLSKGCTITAYHYNIVTNTMLLSSGIHLTSFAGIKDYWKNPMTATIRVALYTFLLTVTGILLANQNSIAGRFPSAIPNDLLNERSYDIFLPAACFQAVNDRFLETLGVSFGQQSWDAFINSKVNGNVIPGWNCYLISIVFYILSAILEIIRCFRRGAQSNPQGLRSRTLSFLKLSWMARPQQHVSRSDGFRHWFSRSNIMFYSMYFFLISAQIFGAYLISHSMYFIFNLRMWARMSRWLIHEGDGTSAEDDWASFGQLATAMLLGVIALNMMDMVGLFIIRESIGSSDKDFNIFGDMMEEWPEHSLSIIRERGFMVWLDIGNRERAFRIRERSRNANRPGGTEGLGPVSAFPGQTQTPESPTFTTDTNNVQLDHSSTSNQPGSSRTHGTGPGVMVTTPTTAQIVQFPSNYSTYPTSYSPPAHRSISHNQNNYHQPSSSSDPASPVAGGDGYYPQQQQAQQRTMSMASTHVGSASPPPQPQGGPYFQPTSSSPVMFQQPQYATYTAYSATPPPQARGHGGGEQGQQGHGQGPVDHQAME